MRLYNQLSVLYITFQHNFFHENQTPTAHEQMYFQQGRLTLGKLCIGPQRGHPRTRPGMDFICTVPRPHLLGCALIWPYHTLTLFAIQQNFWTTLGWIRQTLMRLYNQLSVLYITFQHNFFHENQTPTAHEQMYFQQGRLTLGKLCIGPQRGHPRTRPGMDFICTVPRPHLLGCALIWPYHSGATTFGLFGSYPSNLSKSTRFVFLAGKASLVSISDAILFLRSSMFIYRQSLNCREKIVQEREHSGRDVISFFLTCVRSHGLLHCVLNCMEGEFEQIITKIRLSIKDNNN